MSSMQDKVRALWNTNGRTHDEALVFRAKAKDIAEKSGLRWFINDLIREAEEAARKADAHANAKAAEGEKKRKSTKGKKSSKAEKPIKDDGRKRVIKTVTGTDARGRNKWSVHSTVSHADMKRVMAELRAAGHTVKSEIVKK